jgi:hypothetical protein
MAGSRQKTEETANVSVFLRVLLFRLHLEIWRFIFISGDQALPSFS